MLQTVFRRFSDVTVEFSLINRTTTLPLADLVDAGCELLTITQYLRPSPRHHPVSRWVPPAEFDTWGERALALGFAGVMSGPLVRSSYRAGRLYRQAVEQRATRG